MRGCRYTAPSLAFTVYEVNHISLNYIISKSEGILFIILISVFRRKVDYNYENSYES